jgi:hypothetical protein
VLAVTDGPGPLGLWKATRWGELRARLPIMYEHGGEGQIIKLADEAIRETIALEFPQF